MTNQREPEYPEEMTEAVWLVSDDPDWMLHMVSCRTDKRKLRLFSCACCRLIWNLLSDDRSKRGVEVSERYADGLASEEELEAAAIAARIARDAFQMPFWNQQAPYPGDAAFSAPVAAVAAVEAAAFKAVAETGEMDDRAIYLAQAKLIRDIFGNPFHPQTVDPSWLTTTVVGLATAIYDDRAFACLPILADALEDAGCNNADVLQHCRGEGPHVRGCWALDLILGKE